MLLAGIIIMKKYSNYRLWLVTLTIAFIVQTITLGVVVTWTRTHIHNLDRELSVSSLQASVALGNSQYLPVIADVNQNKIFIPALRLALPLSDQTIAITYAKSGEKQVSISNRAALSVPYDTSQQRDCTSLIRIVEEPKVNSFNPSDKHVRTLVLTDGRTLQLYANVPKSCTSSFQSAGIAPEKFAELFNNSTSY